MNSRMTRSNRLWLGLVTLFVLVVAGIAIVVARANSPSTASPKRAMEEKSLSVASFNRAVHARHFDGTPMTCDGCHADSRYQPDFLSCATCHFQNDSAWMVAHRARIDNDCTTCHSSYCIFDHATELALSGAHTELTCETCHSNHNFINQERTCADCHPVPEHHADRIEARCLACHTDTAWLPGLLLEHPFDAQHGTDGEIVCVACHTTNYMSVTCTGCHDHAPPTLTAQHVALKQPSHGLDECGICHAVQKAPASELQAQR